jgi:hypothetical protein
MMGKYISGFAKESNLDNWASYAQKNSYGDNKAQCKEQLAPVGRGDREDDWKADKWQEPQKKTEGRGWADMKATTADNTYTGNGSKRD